MITQVSDKALSPGPKWIGTQYMVAVVIHKLKHGVSVSRVDNVFHRLRS